jgi:hypothetical protein
MKKATQQKSKKLLATKKVAQANKVATGTPLRFKAVTVGELNANRVSAYTYIVR